MSVLTFKTAAQTPESNSENFLVRIAGSSIEGFWSLNIDESDNIEQKIQALIQKSYDTPDKMTSKEQTKTPAISISIFPPEKLALLGGEDGLTINEFYPDVVSTRTLITDGQIHFYHTSNSEVAVRAQAIKNRLSVETLSPRGNQMLETFELSTDGGKLRVSILISDSDFNELLTLQRIYDRAVLDDFSE